ncbi:protein GrpE-like [Salvia splendens]|uniref:protein GrpE-like n=1 Tax=Salvia splendens TaxID=180675 RepID=UPI0010FFD9F0|nr:protein GrpE-like [Salvia splendens]
MAASASLSSLFSLYSHRSVSCPSPSSKTSYNLLLQPTTTPALKACSQLGNPRFGNKGFRKETRSSLNPDSEAYNEDEPSSERAASNKPRPDMKSLMQLYKEAIAYGDVRAIYEIENILFRIDKEKIELVDKVEALSAEVSTGKEKILRLQADFDNYRKRSEKERASVRSDAQGEVIESLLPMVDSFERAKQQLKIETEMEKKIDTSYQGIYKQFVEIMRSLRVAAVPTVGKPFDPSMHEAIAREESHEFKEGIVTQEFRRGFSIGDRLIRPAMVKVSTGPGRKKPLSEQQPSVARVDNR